VVEIRFNDRVSVRRAVLDDIVEIALDAREADEREVYAWGRHSIQEALLTGFRNSDVCLTATLDGHAEVMFGVGCTSVLTGQATPWMLGTNQIDRHHRMFWQCSVQWVNALRLRYPFLKNHVDDRHEKSKRWLTRLGFSIGEPVILGYQRLPFRPFTMRGANV